jgi:hypothetical protein
MWSPIAYLIQRVWCLVFGFLFGIFLSICTQITAIAPKFTSLLVKMQA